MSDTNFFEMSAGEMPKPVNPPPGDYIFRITGYNKGNYKNENAYQYVRVTLKPMERLDEEIPEEEFKMYTTIQHDFVLTEKAAHIATEWFTDVFGMDVEPSFKELFEDVLGEDVRGITDIEMWGKNKHRPVVKRFLPVDSV